MTLAAPLSVEELLDHLAAAEAAIVTLRAVVPHLDDEQRLEVFEAVEPLVKLADSHASLMPIGDLSLTGKFRQTPEQRIRQAMDKLATHEALASLNGVSKPWLVATILDQIMGDEQWSRPLLKKYVNSFIDRQVTGHFAATRGLTFMGADKLVTKQALRDNVARLAEKFATWVEHAGDRHLKLLSMRRGDLLQAALEREKRGLTELRLALLWRRLAEKMTADQQVSDVFTEEQIAEIAARLEVVVVPSEIDFPTDSD